MRKTLIKSELKDKIIRHLGWPVVRVELHESQLDDVIEDALIMFKQWALGDAVQERYFTLLLESGKQEYDLPEEVTEIISLTDNALNLGNANELFTVENLLKMNGMLDFDYGPSVSLLNLYAVKAYIKDLRRFMGNKYHWVYLHTDGILRLDPAPIQNEYILLQSFMSDGDEMDYSEGLFAHPWIFNYSLALAKIILGRIRTKFSNFQSIGNTGISLDGSDLLNEGLNEKEKLEEILKNEYCYEGYYPVIG